jgi:hypothetical protein
VSFVFGGFGFFGFCRLLVRGFRGSFFARLFFSGFPCGLGRFCFAFVAGSFDFVGYGFCGFAFFFGFGGCFFFFGFGVLCYFCGFFGGCFCFFFFSFFLCCLFVGPVCGGFGGGRFCFGLVEAFFGPVFSYRFFFFFGCFFV